MAESIENYSITPHAAFEMQRRGIEESLLDQVLASPEQREGVRAGRDVLQSLVTLEGRSYLVRVFVDVDRKPAEVVTVYLTSKISKYWRTQP